MLLLEDRELLLLVEVGALSDRVGVDLKHVWVERVLVLVISHQYLIGVAALSHGIDSRYSASLALMNLARI